MTSKLQVGTIEYLVCNCCGKPTEYTSSNSEDVDWVICSDCGEKNVE